MARLVDLVGLHDVSGLIPGIDPGTHQSVQQKRSSSVGLGATALNICRDLVKYLLPPQLLMKASRSALIVSAWVVGMPCGKPL